MASNQGFSLEDFSPTTRQAQGPLERLYYDIETALRGDIGRKSPFSPELVGAHEVWAFQFKLGTGSNKPAEVILSDPKEFMKGGSAAGAAEAGLLKQAHKVTSRPNIAMVGWNNTAFDSKVLAARLRHSGINPTPFKALKQIDMMVEAQKAFQQIYGFSGGRSFSLKAFTEELIDALDKTPEEKTLLHQRFQKGEIRLHGKRLSGGDYWKALGDETATKEAVSYAARDVDLLEFIDEHTNLAKHLTDPSASLNKTLLQRMKRYEQVDAAVDYFKDILQGPQGKLAKVQVVSESTIGRSVLSRWMREDKTRERLGFSRGDIIWLAKDAALNKGKRPRTEFVGVQVKYQNKYHRFNLEESESRLSFIKFQEDIANSIGDKDALKQLETDRSKILGRMGTLRNKSSVDLAYTQTESKSQTTLSASKRVSKKRFTSYVSRGSQVKPQRISPLVQTIFELGGATEAEMRAARLPGMRLVEIVERYLKNRGLPLVRSEEEIRKLFISKGVSPEKTDEYVSNITKQIGSNFNKEGVQGVYVSTREKLLKDSKAFGGRPGVFGALVFSHEAVEAELRERGFGVGAPWRKQASKHLNWRIFGAEMEFASLIGPEAVRGLVGHRAKELGETLGKVAGKPELAEAEKYLKKLPYTYKRILSAGGYQEDEITEFLDPIRKSLLPDGPQANVSKRSTLKKTAQNLDETTSRLMASEGAKNEALLESNLAASTPSVMGKKKIPEAIPTQGPIPTPKATPPRGSKQIVEEKKALGLIEKIVPGAIEDQASPTLKAIQGRLNLSTLERSAPYMAAAVFAGDLLLSERKLPSVLGLGAAAGAAFLTKGKSLAFRTTAAVGAYTAVRILTGSLANRLDGNNEPPIEGFQSGGFSQGMRHSLTDFGSGQQLGALRNLASKVGKALEGILPKGRTITSELGRARTLASSEGLLLENVGDSGAAFDKFSTWMAANFGKSQGALKYTENNWNDSLVRRWWDQHLSPALDRGGAQEIEQRRLRESGRWHENLPQIQQQAPSINEVRSKASRLQEFKADDVQNAILHYATEKGKVFPVAHEPAAPIPGLMIHASEPIAVNGIPLNQFDGVPKTIAIQPFVPKTINLPGVPTVEAIPQTMVLPPWTGEVRKSIPPTPPPKSTLAPQPSPFPTLATDARGDIAIDLAKTSTTHPKAVNQAIPESIRPKEQTFIPPSRRVEVDSVSTGSSVGSQTTSQPKPVEPIKSPPKVETSKNKPIKLDRLDKGWTESFTLGTKAKLAIGAAALTAVGAGFLIGGKSDRSRQDSENASPYGSLYRRGHPRALEGFTHGGMAADSRQSWTDFGTGWDPLRAMARSIFKMAEGQESRAMRRLFNNDEFQEALGRGTFVEKIGKGGIGTVDLMETTYQGHSFKYARKSYTEVSNPEIVDAEESFLLGLQDEVSPSVYGRGKVHVKTTNARGDTIGKDVEALYMEYIPKAETVESIREGGRLLKKQEKRSIAYAVSKMHQKNLIHGDLNSRNVMIDHLGRTIIIDPMSLREGRFGKAGGELMKQADLLSLDALISDDSIKDLHRRALGAGEALSNMAELAEAGLTTIPTDWLDRAGKMRWGSSAEKILASVSEETRSYFNQIFDIKPLLKDAHEAEAKFYKTLSKAAVPNGLDLVGNIVGDVKVPSQVHPAEINERTIPRTALSQTKARTAESVRITNEVKTRANLKREKLHSSAVTVGVSARTNSRRSTRMYQKASPSIDGDLTAWEPTLGRTMSMYTRRR